jgi:hypothetical protein
MLEHGMALALGTQQRILGQLHILERQLGGAAAFHAAIATLGDAGGVAVDQEQADAGSIEHAACGARRHQQQIGLFAKGHHALGAVEHPARGGPGRRGRDLVELVVAARFVVRQGGDHAAGDDVLQLALLRIAAGRNQGLAHDQRAQQRLGHQAAAQ